MIRKKIGRAAALLASMATIVATTSLLLAAPAQAAYPSTFKICNSSESSDTNGSAADGGNFDVTRAASGGAAAYSNELVPGECTGSTLSTTSTQTSLIRLDFTDDGVNTGLDSVNKGVDGDGIDDSQGPWDGGCLDTNAITNENLWPIPQTLAEHTIAASGYRIDVRLRDSTLCGANDLDTARTCNDPASTKKFDVFKTDDSYSNELLPGECTNWKNTVGSNPLRADLSDDGLNSVIEWKKNENGGTWDTCERDTPLVDGGGTGGDTLAPDVNGGEDYTLTDYATSEDATPVAIHATHNIRTYNDGTSASTLCGVAVAAPVNSAGAPTPDPQQTTGDLAGLSAAEADPANDTANVPGLAREGTMTDAEAEAESDVG